MKAAVLVSMGCLLLSPFAHAQWQGNGSSIYYNSGNVGIGVSNPATTLHVNSSTPILSTGNGSGFKFRDWTTGQDWHWYALDNSARLHQVGAGAQSDRLVITNSGNIGIGNSAPPHKLSVNGDIYARGHMFLHAFEGEFNSGTAYLQARNNNVSGTNIDLRLRTQSNGQVIDVMHLTSGGNVGIGTLNPGYKLAVNGTVGAKEVRVTQSNWSDFVFDHDYKLPSLQQVEAYVQTHKHLPDIPSAKEVEKNGISLGSMDAKLLQKIEELTLYIIQQQKEIECLKKHALKN